MSRLQVKLSFDDGKTAEWYDVESLDHEYKDVTFIDEGGESVEIDYWNQPLRIKSQLNEDQQIVLEWLKKTVGIEGSLTKGLYSLYHLNLVREDFINREQNLILKNVRTAFRTLTRMQEAQVLQAFSQWALEQEAE